MNEDLIFHFAVDGSDFTSAGQASVQLKKNLRQLLFFVPYGCVVSAE